MKRAIVRILDAVDEQPIRISVQVVGEGTQVYEWTQEGLANLLEDFASLIAKRLRRPVAKRDGPDPLEGQIIG